jgi:hypothetical protein
MNITAEHWSTLPKPHWPPFNIIRMMDYLSEGGCSIKTHGFRKEPFATRHRLTGNFAFDTHAFNFDYKGEFIDVIHGLDIETNAQVQGPSFVNNFFGYGNESLYDEDEQEISFYRARVRSIKLNALLIKNIFRTQKLFIGPAFETYQVENTMNRFILNWRKWARGEYCIQAKELHRPKAGFSL